MLLNSKVGTLLNSGQVLNLVGLEVARANTRNRFQLWEVGSLWCFTVLVKL